MNSANPRAPSSEGKRKPELIAMPRPHDGVRRALLGSFGAVQALPMELVRLLERLR